MINAGAPITAVAVPVGIISKDHCAKNIAKLSVTQSNNAPNTQLATSSDLAFRKPKCLAMFGAIKPIKLITPTEVIDTEANQTPTEELSKALVQHVRSEIGPIAAPDAIQWAPSLPKTRSGKIMRRILRKIAENNFDNIGDTSTLLNPEVVDYLIEHRLNK